MDSGRPRSHFQSDLDFCPDCGSILPLPGVEDTVTCIRCGFSVDVRGEGLARGAGARGRGERGRRPFPARVHSPLSLCADFEQKVVKTTFVFHKVGTAVPVAADDGPEFQGPVVSSRRRGPAPRGGQGGNAGVSAEIGTQMPEGEAGVSAAAAACGVRTVSSGSGQAPQGPLTRPC